MHSPESKHPDCCRGFHSLSGCDKLSRPGAALGLAALTQLVDLDLSYIGATPPDDEDVETARELQDGLNGIGYSTWVSTRVAIAVTVSAWLSQANSSPRLHLC